jgi:hypothetical protein
MESSKSSGCGKVDWLKFLQEVLRNDPESSGLENHQLLENPTFLKAVLIAFLSMIGETCACNSIEITRVIDFDCLESVSDNCGLTFKIIQDYGGHNYLQVTVRDQSYLLKGPGLAASENRPGFVNPLSRAVSLSNSSPDLSA